MIGCKGKVKKSRILLTLGEKGISVTENAIEKWGYDTNTETAWSFRVCI